MKKLVVCAVALCGFAVSAQAADLGLDSLKDPLPDTLTYKGVTVYGAIDISAMYLSNGAPNSGYNATGPNAVLFGNRNMDHRIFSIGENGLTQSFIGAKFEEQIAPGWTAFGKIETGFNPTFGELTNACQSVAEANGKYNGNAALANTTASFGDGSRCGQALNGQVYVGVTAGNYGTLTVGRINSLDLDMMLQYDPMGMSYDFSLIGNSGGAGSGTGATETARQDNSVRYALAYGPVHAAAQYAQGSTDDSIQKNAFGFNVGGTWRGLSVDVVYSRTNGAITGSQPLSPTQQAQIQAIGLDPQKSISSTYGDDEAWSIGAKYTFDLGGYGLKDGGCGFKDDCSGAKLTFYGGFQHTDLFNAGSLQGTQPVGAVTVGGVVVPATNIAVVQTIGGYNAFLTQNAYGSTKQLETSWLGAKYESGPWAFTGAAYHLEQNSFLNSKGANCASVAAAQLPTFGKQIGSNCPGNFWMESFLVDYTFTKHFDVYAGVTNQEINGGPSSGFLATNTVTAISGIRFKF